MTFAAILILGFIICTGVGFLGMYLIPKMVKDVGESGFGFLIAVYLAQIIWGGFWDDPSLFLFFQSIGFLIPLIGGSYIATAIKRTGTTTFDKSFSYPEMQHAIIANCCFGILITLNEAFA